MKKISILFVFALMSCTPVFFAQKDRVRATKKVALVGMLLEVERANHFTLSIDKSGVSGSARRDKEPEEPAISEAQIADQLADLIETHVSTTLHLGMEPWRWVAKSEAYHEALRRRKKTLVFASIPPHPVDRFRPTQLASEAILDSLDSSERDQMIADLKVDAVATAVVKISLNRDDRLKVGNFTAGTYRPSAIVEYRMFARGQKDPIWQDRMAAGKLAERSVNQVSGVTSQDSLEISFKEATLLAIETLMERFNKGE